MKKKVNQEFDRIFGPVPSRRLGLSLGVDLMPHKTCSLDCVYCECGRTTHLTIQPREYTPVDQIRRELDSFLSTRPQIDFLTFSGSGEPTLHSGIDEIIQYMKTDYPEYSVAILTNGTLFHLPAVRKRVLQADVIISSFDAASEAMFKKINRPHPSLSLDDMLDGITALKKEFANQLWMEVFIIPGHNDDQEELGRIQQVMDRIQPDQIQINSLDRPGTESWVKPVDQEVLKTIQACMHNVSMVDKPGASRSVNTFAGDLKGRIVSTIRRRPCTVADISEITGANENKINQHLDILLKNGEVVKKQMPRGTFFFLKQQAESMKPDLPV